MSQFELIQIVAEGSRTTISFSSEHLNRRDTARQIAGQLSEHLLTSSTESHHSGVLKIDFGDIDRLSSAGLNALIGINSQARNRGVRLVLLDVQAAVRDVFTLTRLERLFEFDSTAVNA